MKPYAYAAPGDLAEAVALLVEHGDDAHLMAGGTAVVQLLKQGLLEPAVVVGLDRLDGLRDIRLDGDVLEIGALVLLRRLEAHPLVLRHAPALASTVARVATVRIRNQATIGGNLAHADPAQDPPPMLLAHDASVVLAGPAGARIVALDDFFVDVFETVIAPDEILTAIRVPVPVRTQRFAYRKFLPRTADDYATVSVAVRLDLDEDGTIRDARIGLANAGPVPFRATEAEAVLRGRPATQAAFEEAAGLAATGADPVGDVRGSSDYKRAMARVWTARALHAALDTEAVA